MIPSLYLIAYIIVNDVSMHTANADSVLKICLIILIAVIDHFIRFGKIWPKPAVAAAAAAAYSLRDSTTWCTVTIRC